MSRRIPLLRTGAAVAVALTVSLQPGIAGAAELVYKVLNVGVTIEKKNPPILVVTASGEVRTGGWSNPELKLVQDSPVEGVYMVEFVAQRPSGEVTGAITPITAPDLSIETVPGEETKGVRVKAETNCILYLFTDQPVPNPDNCDIIATM